MINLLIVTHGTLGEILISIAQKIVGSATNIRALTNHDFSYRDLSELISNTLDGFPEGDEVLILADLYGGSCWNAAVKAARNRSNTRILSGCNLPMVISYCAHRDSTSFNDLVELVKNRGISSIISSD